MVHKKSEYKLQYHHLTKDLRKEIWQQNIKFRELHRSLNQAHHYWTYQVTDDKCECDSDHQERAGADSALLHRAKHQILAGHQNGRSSDSCSQKSDGEAGKEVGCQTPDWKGEGRRLDEPGSSRGGGSPPERPATAKSSAPTTAAVGTAGRGEALLPVERPQSSGGKLSSTSSHPNPPKDTAPPRCLRREKTVHNLPVNNKPAFSSSGNRSRSPTRFAQLSRTSRRAFCEVDGGKMVPFTSYGWNDSRRNVGEKKTYNVCAPEPENVVNHSSIWMSEYQDQFSHRAARAKSAPPLRKTGAWF